MSLITLNHGTPHGLAPAAPSRIEAGLYHAAEAALRLLAQAGAAVADYWRDRQRVRWLAKPTTRCCATSASRAAISRGWCGWAAAEAVAPQLRRSLNPSPFRPKLSAATPPAKERPEALPHMGGGEDGRRPRHSISDPATAAAKRTSLSLPSPPSPALKLSPALSLRHKAAFA